MKLFNNYKLMVFEMIRYIGTISITCAPPMMATAAGKPIYDSLILLPSLELPPMSK